MSEQHLESRIKALAERSSYVENVLRHSLVASLSSAVWLRDPFASLQVFNAEVDDSGFDLVLTLGKQARYIQLKQAHSGKVPSSCSIRLSFSEMVGSCIVLMSHCSETLALESFRFFGSGPEETMAGIGDMRVSKSPGRRTADGERKVRTNYRDVPVRDFVGPLSTTGLLDHLFPPG